MEDLGRSYVGLVFIASLGVIQLAAAHAGLTKLLFVKSKALTCFLGLTLIVASFTWFFWDGPRHIPDTAGGLDGNDQALLFLLGAVSATIITALLTSIVNARLAGREPEPGEGLEALAHNSYAKAVRHSLRYWWRNWRTQTKSYFSG